MDSRQLANDTYAETKQNEAWGFNMFIVDTKTKQSTQVMEEAFTSLGFKERNDLQEWIVNQPAMLGEELLIIQKEFSGFSDTNERLDLLAIDLKGNLVIIENKLDDSGKDVTWQAMKYASYCSTLSKDAIRKLYHDYLQKYEQGADAEENICEFLRKADFAEVQLNHDLTQRIILVARKFQKEVTSVVLWARKFRIQIQCVKLIPYMIDGKLVIDTEQIIPVKDIADIVISYDEKALDEMVTGDQIAKNEKIHARFWEELLPKMNEKSELFKGINAGNNRSNHWLGTGSGISGVSYEFVATKKYASVQIGIMKAVQEENKKIFDKLFTDKESIEKSFGAELEWQRLDNKKMSRIAYKLDGANVFNTDKWDEIQDFLIKSMIRFNEVFKPYIAKIKN